MAEGTPKDGRSLRAAIMAEHERILARIFSGDGQELADPRLGARYLALAGGLADLPREHLLGLKLMADARAQAPEVTGAPATEARRAQAVEDLLLFRRLADSSGHGFVVADARGEIVYANVSLCRMYGLGGPAEAVGRSLADFLPEERRSDFAAEILAPVLREGRWVGELDIRSLQGAETPTIQNLFVVPEGRGGPPHIASLVLDISDRKRMEEDLRQSEETYRALAEQAWSGLLVMDTRGRTLYVNPRFEELSGYPAGEFLKMDAFTIVHPEDRERIREIARARASGTPAPHQYEMRILRASGEVVSLAVSAASTVWQGTPAGFAFLQDITWRKQAEEALRESEEKYRELVEGSDAVTFTTDTTGRITFISAAIEALTGFTPAEAVGRATLDLVHPDDRPVLIERFPLLIAGEALEPREYRIRSRQGPAVWVRIFSRPMLREGRVIGLRGVILDIHARKMAEEELRASEEKYRELVENLSEVIFAIDTRGDVAYVSPAVRALTGYEPSEIEGRNFSRFVHDEDLPSLARDVELLLAGEVPGPSEYRVVHRDGGARWVRSASRPIRREGAVTGLRGVMVDIHERRVIETELRESEAKYALLVEEAQVGVVIVQDGLVRYANRYAAAIIGYSPAEVAGRPLTEFITPEERGLQAGIHDSRLRGEGAPEIYRARGLRRDGSTVTVENRATRIHYDGRPAALVIVRDLREGDSRETEQAR